jgi:hypothetical protein
LRMSATSVVKEPLSYTPVVFTLFDSRCSVLFCFALYFAIRPSPVLKPR